MVNALVLTGLILIVGGVFFSVYQPLAIAGYFPLPSYYPAGVYYFDPCQQTWASLPTVANYVDGVPNGYYTASPESMGYCSGGVMESTGVDAPTYSPPPATTTTTSTTQTSSSTTTVDAPPSTTVVTTVIPTVTTSISTSTTIAKTTTVTSSSTVTTVTTSTSVVSQTLTSSITTTVTLTSTSSLSFGTGLSGYNQVLSFGLAAVGVVVTLVGMRKEKML